MTLKCGVVLAAGLLVTSNMAVAAVPPKGADDLLGQQNLIQLREQVDLVARELSKLESLMGERQRVISYQKKENEYRYFNVMPGSFRKQLEDFKTRIGVQKVRWDPGVPTSCDWSFDTSFKIDVTDQKQAMKEFFSGLPLNPILFSRDNSLMVYPINYMEPCTP